MMIPSKNCTIGGQLAFIYRDHSGQAVHVTTLVQNASFPLNSELFAIKAAMVFACSHLNKVVEMELDCKITMDLCNSSILVPPWEAKTFVKAI